jgi:hypothetical protein
MEMELSPLVTLSVVDATVIECMRVLEHQWLQQHEKSEDDYGIHMQFF